MAQHAYRFAIDHPRYDCIVSVIDDETQIHLTEYVSGGEIIIGDTIIRLFEKLRCQIAKEEK